MILNEIKINDTATVTPGVVYDISKATGQSYETLSDALSGNNVPLEIREGGMTVRFVLTSNNKYVQYRLMSNTFSTDEDDWQGVDEQPTAGSDNLVKSGGIARFYGYYVEDENFKWILTDSQGRIILSVKKDGDIEWSKGIPTPISNYIDLIIKELNLDSVSKIIEFIGDYFNGTENIEDLLNKKVDKENGKSLIPIQYIQEIDDDNISVKTDSKGRICEVIKNNGEMYSNSNYTTSPAIYNTIVPKRLEVSEPFTSAICIDGEYCYGGHSAITNVTKYKFGRHTRPEVVGDGCNVSKPGVKHLVRTIACKGDYLFVSMRGNGFGYWDYDTKKAEFRALWDGRDIMSGVFTNYTYNSNASIKYDDTADSPGRGMGCCKMIGGGSSFLSAPKDIVTGDIVLFMKIGKANTTDVYIPILKQSTSDVLGLIIDEQNRLGLKVNGISTISDYTVPVDWINIKIRIYQSSSTVELYVRSGECETNSWGRIVTVQDSVNSDTICIGIDTEEDITVYVDDLEYNPTDIEAVSYNAGRIVIVNKNTMTIVKAYDINIRAHDIIINKNILYLALNGGLNVYQISNDLQSLKLLCCYRYSDVLHKHNIWGTEMQGMKLFSANNKTYLATTNWIFGLTILDVTDSKNVKFVIRYGDIPFYANGGWGAYHEWDIEIDYPFIYTTVGGNHGVLNLGADLPVGMEVITGLKVRDITNIYSPKTRIITVPEFVNPYPIVGDPLPISMTKIADKLMLGYGDKGIAVFEAKGLNTEYLYNILPNYSSNSKFLSKDNDLIYIADGAKLSNTASINVSVLNFNMIMNKCLFTQLKGSFNDNEMPYYKKIRLTGNSVDDGGLIDDNPYISIAGNYTITSESMTKIADVAGREIDLPYTSHSSSIVRFRALEGESLDIFVEGNITEVKLSQISILGNYLSLLQFPTLKTVNVVDGLLNVNFLKENTYIESINCTSTGMSTLIGDVNNIFSTHISSITASPKNSMAGDISNLANKDYIQVISLPTSSSLYGNIECFGNCMLLTGLYFTNSADVYGDINKLAKILYDNGKISGVLKVLVSGTKCTNSYSGSALSNALRVNITFTETGFTMSDV